MMEADLAVVHSNPWRPNVRTFLIMLVLLAAVVEAAPQVNGQVQIIDGKPILTVWGTHAERGYAQGYLKGAEGKEVFEDYIVGFCAGGSPFIYAFLRSHFLNNYAVDTEYQVEAAGIIQGLLDAGVDPHVNALGRDIDATDLLVSNAIVDLSTVAARDFLGCSSLSSWGASTVGDPVLAGHLVITRHLDWSKHPTLTDNPLLTVHLPSEPDEQPWISIGYAGLFGALSSVSQSGVSAFLNMGNNDSGTSGAPYHPILLTLRSGIESADYDGNGEHTPDDIVAAIEDRTRRVDTIVHVTDDEGLGSRPIIIESNNANGVAVRDRSDNTMIPGDNLVATNHFRVLYPPVYCNRYEAIADSLTASTDITCDRSWSLMAGAAGSFSSNIQCIEYVESLGLLRWSMDTYTQPAYLRPPTELSVSDLFECQMEVAEATPHASLGQNFPNPFGPSTSIRFSIPEPGHVRISVYDVAGRLVARPLDGPRDRGEHEVPWDGLNRRGEPVAAGVYFCRLEHAATSESRAMVLLR
jgi:hypothetical protein